MARVDLERYKAFVNGMQELMATSVKVRRHRSFVTVVFTIMEASKTSDIDYESLHAKGELADVMVFCGQRVLAEIKGDLVHLVRSDSAGSDHGECRVTFKGQVR